MRLCLPHRRVDPWALNLNSLDRVDEARDTLTRLLNGSGIPPGRRMMLQKLRTSTNAGG